MFSEIRHILQQIKQAFSNQRPWNLPKLCLPHCILSTCGFILHKYRPERYPFTCFWHFFAFHSCSPPKMAQYQLCLTWNAQSLTQCNLFNVDPPPPQGYTLHPSSSVSNVQEEYWLYYSINCWNELQPHVKCYKSTLFFFLLLRCRKGEDFLPLITVKHFHDK